ncbi:MAG: prepilin-type N-terminal cleavage/methylation domain-containing protein [Planctomycetaceae bacterium]|nr:prepilin-type N-terminal cleavage/methylation domain-containing protein [Planctomycetaceae bacterium]
MRNSTRKMNRRGISMVELMVVTLVMGIMAAVAAPKFAAALQHHALEMAAKRIVADLESARSLAYTTGVSQTVRFSTSSGRYQHVGLVDPDRPTVSDYTVDITDAPYGCAFKNVSNEVLTYNGHGLPNTGTEIIVFLGNIQRTITVSATTGRATYL